IQHTKPLGVPAVLPLKCTKPLALPAVSPVSKKQSNFQLYTIPKTSCHKHPPK
ncbi:hypothetical protein KSS87_003038, partial [Heliosperma pusillum]